MTVLVAKPEEQSWIPQIDKVEGEKTNSQESFSDLHVLLWVSAHMHACIYAYMQTQNK